MLGGYKSRPTEQRKFMAGSVVVEAQDQWVLNLAIAAVKQAADDLRAAYRSHDDGNVQALQKWFLSEWGQLLSFGQGGGIIRRIKKEEEEREQDET